MTVIVGKLYGATWKIFNLRNMTDLDGKQSNDATWERRFCMGSRMCLTTLFLCLWVTVGITKGFECSAGCNPENGFCETPGQCRCHPGWQGATCDQCITFPGCLHGSCQRAWQCVCEPGWVGSQCDQNTSQCSSKPCSGNATCIETGEGGYLCVCPAGYTGNSCHLKKDLCLPDGSSCLNGGWCRFSGARPSCLCPPGFSGESCETAVAEGLARCTGPTCNGADASSSSASSSAATSSSSFPSTFSSSPTANSSSPSPPPPRPLRAASLCAGRPCAHGASCVPLPGGALRCVCRPGFSGATCAHQQHRPREAGPRLPPPPPQHYSLPAHAFHKLLRPPAERDLLKITVHERVQSPGGLSVTRAQLLCFGLLALLTCLVVLGTMAIVFLGRCEAWLANVRYSQLVHRQSEQLLKEAGVEVDGDEGGHSVNIILPEKIKLASFSRHYTSI